MDDQGLVVSRLEEILETCRPAFLYTIPFFHNPTGITLSLERQEALAALCKQHDLMVVADEVYWFLYFDQPPPPPPPPSLGRFHEDIPVLSLGSFSKILAPGLRLGWIHAGPDTIKTFSRSGLLQSGGGLNPFTSAAVEEVIRTGGLLAQIEAYRKIYWKRAQAFCRQLKAELPPCVDIRMPDGGYFFWIEFPRGVDLFSLRKQIQAHDVDVYPGPYFDPESAPGTGSTSRFSPCIRLAFSLYDTAGLKEGTARLGRVLRKNLPELYP